MTTVDLRKYLDERGRAVLANEQKLSELGLTVVKAPAGNRLPVASSGGVLGLYDLSFVRRDRNFSQQLVEFLTNEIKLSPAEIQQLEEQSEYNAISA